jgi:hypothetical protein
VKHSNQKNNKPKGPLVSCDFYEEILPLIQPPSRRTTFYWLSMTVQHLYSIRNNRKVKKAACHKEEMARQCGRHVGKPEGK